MIEYSLCIVQIYVHVYVCTSICACTLGGILQETPSLFLKGQSPPGSWGLQILLDWVATKPPGLLLPVMGLQVLSRVLTARGCWISNCCLQACGRSTSLTELSPNLLLSMLII